MKRLLIYDKQFLVKVVAMAAIFGVILFFAYLKTANLVDGPEISILSPSEATVYEDNFIEIKGLAERISKIYLNDRQIFTDTKGYFREPLLLFAGYNILTLRAEDQFGRTVVKKLHVVHTPKALSVPTNSNLSQSTTTTPATDNTI